MPLFAILTEWFIVVVPILAVIAIPFSLVIPILIILHVVILGWFSVGRTSILNRGLLLFLTCPYCSTNNSSAIHAAATASAMVPCHWLVIRTFSTNWSLHKNLFVRALSDAETNGAKRSN